jgi:hypothetical protein
VPVDSAWFRTLVRRFEIADKSRFGLVVYNDCAVVLAESTRNIETASQHSCQVGSSAANSIALQVVHTMSWASADRTLE